MKKYQVNQIVNTILMSSQGWKNIKAVVENISNGKMLLSQLKNRNIKATVSIDDSKIFPLRKRVSELDALSLNQKIELANKLGILAEKSGDEKYPIHYKNRAGIFFNQFAK